MFFKKNCPYCGTKNPKNSLICVSCGASFELEQVRHQEAIEEYNQAIRSNPDRAESYFNRGFFYQKNGQGELAIMDFDETIRIDPQFIKAYRNRAYSYLNKGYYDQAVADCTKAINLDSKDFVSLLNRGVAYKLQGNEGKAIVDFEKVIASSDNAQVIKMAKQNLRELNR